MLLGDLTSLMLRQESRQHSITWSPLAHVRPDRDDLAAHIRAWDDGGVLPNGSMVVVFSLRDYAAGQQ